MTAVGAVHSVGGVASVVAPFGVVPCTLGGNLDALDGLGSVLSIAVFVLAGPVVADGWGGGLRVSDAVDSLWGGGTVFVVHVVAVPVALSGNLLSAVGPDSVGNIAVSVLEFAAIRVEWVVAIVDRGASLVAAIDVDSAAVPHVWHC